MFSYEFDLTYIPSMTFKIPSSSPFPPESTYKSIDMLITYKYGYNTIAKIYNPSLSSFDSSLSTPIDNFGNLTDKIRKAMLILEAQFGDPHASSSSINNNNNNDVIVNNNMMTNCYASSYHSDLLEDSSSHSQESRSWTINVVIVDGDNVWASNNNNKKKNKKENIDDGRTHNLPYKKHGLYTCSNCNN